MSSPTDLRIADFGFAASARSSCPARTSDNRIDDELSEAITEGEVRFQESMVQGTEHRVEGHVDVGL